MKALERINLIQFFLFEKEQIEIRGNTAVLGRNGSGKSTLLDAVQTVMNGAHGSWSRFNAQSSSLGARSKRRTLRDYCLGVLRENNEDGSGLQGRARDDALTYLTLGFADRTRDWYMTAGICVSASAAESRHQLHGLFILPGVLLTADDLVEKTEEGEVPLAWRDFAIRARRLCDQAGRTPIFKDRPEAYVDELLKQLAPPGKPRLNVTEFLRAFTKSLELRDVESVDEYVRHHVVPPGGIKVEEFGHQIRQFNELKETIDRTRLQIQELEDIHHRYGLLRSAFERQASVTALVEVYRQEEIVETIDRLQDDREQSRQTLALLKRDIEANQDERDLIQQQLDELKIEISRDGRAEQGRLLEMQGESLRQALGEHRDRILSRIRELLQGIRALASMGENTDSLGAVQDVLHQALESLEEQDPESVLEAMRAALSVLGHAAERLESAKDALGQRCRQLEEEGRELNGEIKNLEAGGSRLGRDAARAIDLFDQAGVEARPICDLIEIIDPDWQPAIEAYLGHKQLEHLVVRPGRETEAVRLMRELPRDQAIYGVKVIQPEHLRRHMDDVVEPELVSSLVRSDDQTALAYVRSAMAGLRFAESAHDLARYARALTIDGMVSSGGGTERKPLPAKAALRIGRRSDPSALREAKDRLRQVGEELTRAREEERQLGKVLFRLDEAGVGESEIRQLMGAFRRSLEDLTRIEQERDRSLAPDVRELIEREKAKVEERHAIAIVLEKQIETRGRLVEHLQNLDKDIEQKEGQADAVVERLRTLETQTYYSAETVDDYRQRIDAECERPEEGIQRAQAFLRSFEIDIKRREKDAFQQLSDYAQRHNATLGELRDDWEKALAWSGDESKRLQETDLVRYAEQAEEALKAARESFKRDIAFKLQDQMKKMENSLRQLNRLLETCPPFSQNERYAFTWESREQHRGLRQFIERAGRDEEGTDLFSLDFSGEGQSTSNAMAELEALAQDPSVAAGSAPSVLTDYREFYNFDLNIKQDGRVVDKLSNRTGSGSGGEHRTPFYVIAGAALASAYQLEDGGGGGAGLMLLDEAFYSMDEQNALAAARFLNRLGLQLLMAGPGTDESKLGTFSETLYEIGRFDFDIYLERIHLKDAAHKLLISDMPSEHPQLLEQEVMRIEEGRRESSRP